MRLPRIGFYLGLLLAMAACLPGAARAYSTASGYSAADFATGFPTAPKDAFGQTKGPIGLAFNQSGVLFVTDISNGSLYAFPPGGGDASAHKVNQALIPGTPAGAAFTPDGRLYVARYAANDVVEIDPSNGEVLRTVASNINQATGLAVDPVSGDLFVSANLGSNTIFRISNYASGRGTVTGYAQVPNADGIGFGNDGTLYVEGQENVYSVAGTSTANPGSTTQIAHVPNADGLTFGLPRGSNRLPFLVINRIDGIATRIDFVSQGTTSTDIFTGGSRGDFAAVDPAGCLYLTQSDRVVRVTTSTSTCDLGLAPSTASGRLLVAAEQLLACTKSKLVLVNVLRRGNRVDLLGVADPSLIGRTVTIAFGQGHKTVASAVVGPDAFFHTTAPLPPRRIRNSNRARYQAVLGAERSLSLKLTRRMIVTGLSASGGKVTMTGRIIPPLARPRKRITVQRRVTCTQYVTVKRIKPRRNGKFKATLAAPPNAQAAVYRATTRVPKTRGSRRTHRTFTLPQVVSLP